MSCQRGPRHSAGHRFARSHRGFQRSSWSYPATPQFGLNRPPETSEDPEKLLDAGCGPGVLTVRMASLFETAVGLDPDSDMLAEGRRAAEEADVANICGVQALAEDLPAAAPGPLPAGHLRSVLSLD
ncbi:MAG: class I SAM-dependent methyltransferase [Acidimicrobiales bacterium]